MKKILTEIITDLNIYLTLEKEEKNILLQSILNDLNLIKLSIEKNHSLLRKYFKYTLKYLLFLNETTINNKNKNFEVNKERNIEKIYEFIYYTRNITDYIFDKEYYVLNLIFQLNIIEYYYFPIDEKETIEEYNKSLLKYKNKLKKIEENASNNEVDFIVSEYKKEIIFKQKNENKINLSKDVEISKLITEEIYKIYYSNKTKQLDGYYKNNKNISELIEENYGLSLFLILNIYKKILPTTNILKKEKNKFIKLLMLKKLYYIKELMKLNENYYKSSCYDLLFDNTTLIEDAMFLTFSLNKIDECFHIIGKNIKFINFLLLCEKDKNYVRNLLQQKEDYLILLKLITLNN